MISSNYSISYENGNYFLNKPEAKIHIPKKLFKIFYDSAYKEMQNNSCLTEIKPEIFKTCREQVRSMGKGNFEKTMEHLFTITLDNRRKQIDEFVEVNQYSLDDLEAQWQLKLIKYWLPDQNHPFLDYRKFGQMLYSSPNWEIEFVDPGIENREEEDPSLAAEKLKSPFEATVLIADDTKKRRNNVTPKPQDFCNLPNTFLADDFQENPKHEESRLVSPARFGDEDISKVNDHAERTAVEVNPSLLDIWTAQHPEITAIKPVTYKALQGRLSSERLLLEKMILFYYEKSLPEPKDNWYFTSKVNGLIKTDSFLSEIYKNIKKYYIKKRVDKITIAINNCYSPKENPSSQNSRKRNSKIQQVEQVAKKTKVEITIPSDLVGFKSLIFKYQDQDINNELVKKALFDEFLDECYLKGPLFLRKPFLMLIREIVNQIAAYQGKKPLNFDESFSSKIKQTLVS